MRHATMDDAGRLARLLQRCEAADGRPALSEFKALRVPVANGVRALVSQSEEPTREALGVAAWHPTEIGEAPGYWAAEIVVDPAGRSVEAYEAVAEALESDLAGPVALWTFDDMQAQAATNLGLKEGRAIVEMRRSLPADPSHVPEGYNFRTFVEGADEPMWLALNQKVFAHHPEAGSIDYADFALRMAQPWFNPAGLLILQQGDLPIGYAWTKTHPGRVGEIYMIGLVPGYRGRGLARPLTLAGLAHLARVGATTAMLYAEAANDAAVGLYGSMGFAAVRRVALFEHVVDYPKA